MRWFEKHSGKKFRILQSREDVLGEALKLLELQGIANTTLEMVAERVDYPLDELQFSDPVTVLIRRTSYISKFFTCIRKRMEKGNKLLCSSETCGYRTDKKDQPDSMEK